MNIIDISSWQKGIDLTALFEKNPLDGVVVKASEGTGYVNPEMKGWADWLVNAGKPLGLYHFCTGADAGAEAAHFVKAVKPYLGKAVLFADYEADALQRGTGWLKDFMDSVLELTGIRPLLYCSLGVVQGQDFTAIAAAGYKLWMAQYASNGVVIGFLDDPWQEGSVSPFPAYVMHQYTGNGRLAGYSGALDLDLYPGSYSSWLALAKGEDAPPSALKPADPEIVAEVLAGRYGIGDERVRRLREAGYDPAKVQDMINTLYGTALSCRKYLLPYDEYINSIIKIVRLL